MRNFTDEDREKAIETRRRNRLLKEQEPVKQTEQTKPMSSVEVETKRNQLEAMRLDIEMEKLRRPDTSIDYYGKMLELQQNHNKQIMDMQKQMFDIQLELTKRDYQMPSEDDGMLDTLEALKPMLPLIADGIKKKPTPAQVDTSSKRDVEPDPPAQDVKKEVKKVETADVVEDYKKRIRDGLITEEQAWNDFNEQVPPVVVKQMGREGFKKEFDAIKAGLK